MKCSWEVHGKFMGIIWELWEISMTTIWEIDGFMTGKSEWEVFMEMFITNWWEFITKSCSKYFLNHGYYWNHGES